MKTKQITSNKVSKTPAIHSVCFLAMFMLLSQLGTSQELALASLKQNTITAEVEIADTLNPAFEANQVKVDSMMSLYFRGNEDADNHYTGKKSGKWVIFGTSIIATPALSVIPAIICAKVHPSARNLNIPESTLSHNAAYLKGYKDEAHDIKKKAVWGGYIAGSSLWVAIANFIIL